MLKKYWWYTIWTSLSLTKLISFVSVAILYLRGDALVLFSNGLEL